jgi:hypothetical protein
MRDDILRSGTAGLVKKGAAAPRAARPKRKRGKPNERPCTLCGKPYMPKPGFTRCAECQQRELAASAARKRLPREVR